MNIIDKASEALKSSVDFIVDKNRQLAQLNRLDAIIKTETEIINNAYIALGKIYQKKLEGSTEETSADLLLETIKNSKLRLKKAKTRYEYTAKYGVPKPCCAAADPSVCTEEEYETVTETEEPNIDLDDEDEDITIAYVAPEAESAAKKDEEPPAPVAKAETAAELEANAPAEEKKSDTAAELKKKRSSRKKAVVRESDSEAANENDTKPLV